MEKTQEVIEGNKAIALFMGFSPRTDLHTEGALFMQAPISEGATHSSCFIVDKALDKYDEFPTLEYNSNWSWLMPVVEKIEDMGYSIQMRFTEIKGKNSCWIEIFNGQDWEEICEVEGEEEMKSIIYKTVIQFIKIHNPQTNKR